MEDWSKKEPKFRYMLLDRLRQDEEESIKHEKEMGKHIRAYPLYH